MSTIFRLNHLSIDWMIKYKDTILVGVSRERKTSLTYKIGYKTRKKTVKLMYTCPSQYPLKTETKLQPKDKTTIISDSNPFLKQDSIMIFFEARIQDHLIEIKLINFSFGKRMF